MVEPPQNPVSSGPRPSLDPERMGVEHAACDPARDETPPPPAPLESILASRFPSIGKSLRGLDGRVTLIMLFAPLVLLVFKKYGGSGFFETELAPSSLRQHPRLGILGDFYWFTSCFVFLGAIPLLVLVASPRLRPHEVGLGLGDVRFGLKWVGVLYLVMLPIIIAASRTETFARYYPLNDQIGAHAVAYLKGSDAPEFPMWFLAYEALYMVYFVGWEYFFRGFLTFGLVERMGINGILAANVPFALMHSGKPLPEAIGSIIAGIALGLFALRTRSFWYCWLLHALVALTMDLAAIERRLELS